MSKITVGQWKEDIGLDELSENLYQTIVFSKQVNSHSIAHVFGKTVEESTANAKLIASAPKLREALIDLVRYCEENKTGAELEFAKDTIRLATE